MMVNISAIFLVTTLDVDEVTDDKNKIISNKINFFKCLIRGKDPVYNLPGVTLGGL